MIVSAILYVLRGGVPRRMLPPCLPPWQPVYAWRDAGIRQHVNHHLVMLDRERSGRSADLSAAVVGSQNVETTEAGGPRGYDTGEKTKGRKRHAMVDMGERALVLQSHPADLQDRDGPRLAAEGVRARTPLCEARLRRHGPRPRSASPQRPASP